MKLKKNVENRRNFLKITPTILILMTARSLLCIDSFAEKQTIKAASAYHQVKARINSQSQNWKTYTAKTIDKLTDFTFSKDSQVSPSWRIKSVPGKSDWFFRVKEKDDRWWIIDPEGYPFIHKGVAVFRPEAGLRTIKKIFRQQWGIQVKN